MNKFLICIVGFLALTILSGCVSAREAQNPQPKAEILCEEWGNNLNIPAQKLVLSPQQAVQNFIDACTVGDYDSMPSLESNSPRHDICPTLANATIKKIAVSQDREGYWDVTVMCSDSKQRLFHMKKNRVNRNNKIETEWVISFPVGFR